VRVRSYSELRRLPTFMERFEYLALRGQVGGQTFGFARWLNQRFYASPLWAQVRDVVIMRDRGCDLGIPGREIQVELLVHHMNPIRRRDIVNGEEWILDPEYLITTCHRTHNAIHYGDANLLPELVVERQPGDTRLW
jgi:hypothetical protein